MKPQKIIGKHVYGNLYECKEEILSDEKLLESIAIEAGKQSNMTIWDSKSWKFEEYVCVIVLVVESHIAIHAWAKQRYAVVDVYTCGEKSNPEIGFNYIVSKLKPKKYVKYYVDRSSN